MSKSYHVLLRCNRIKELLKKETTIEYEFIEREIEAIRTRQNFIIYTKPSTIQNNKPTLILSKK